MRDVGQMAKSLNDKNRPALAIALAVNLTVFYLAVQTGMLFSAGSIDLIKGLIAAVPAGAGLILVGVLNAFLPPTAKARIVFLRWRNPLPGSRAFTELGPADPRIDMAVLRRDHSPIPKDPIKQNTRWYQLYKSVETEPAVEDAHRQFLFTRDYASLALIMMVVLGIAGFFAIPSQPTAVAYFALLLLQFGLVARAARTHGHCMVTNVLAAKSAGK